MVAIITGGRPKLTERPTRKFVDSLRAAGVGDIAYVMHERDADSYEEQPGTEKVVYTDEWAHGYAKTHWMLPDPPQPNGFYGAFTGREWACRVAEERGYWGVLQLDDNITDMNLLRHTASGMDVFRKHGQMGLMADLLAAMALSTNAMTVGAQLSAVSQPQMILIRPGFPYSCFIEKTGPGREEWYGPYEDDITHSFQYGDRADGATAALMPILQYRKESQSKTGMRSKYNHERSKQLQRLIPHAAKVGVRATKANGLGDPRVFHTMKASAIRNPIRVRNRELYDQAKQKVEALTAEWYEAEKARNREKIMNRLGKAEGKK
jgi:hypothetical protein